VFISFVVRLVANRVDLLRVYLHEPFWGNSLQKYFVLNYVLCVVPFRDYGHGLLISPPGMNAGATFFHPQADFRFHLYSNKQVAMRFFHNKSQHRKIARESRWENFARFPPGFSYRYMRKCHVERLILPKKSATPLER
jgi:hypothetical protein